jgi:hypothetical protein
MHAKDEAADHVVTEPAVSSCRRGERIHGRDWDRQLCLRDGAAKLCECSH